MPSIVVPAVEQKQHQLPLLPDCLVGCRKGVDLLNPAGHAKECPNHPDMQTAATATATVTTTSSDDSPNCPNRTNPHHTCTSFCGGQYGGTMGGGTAGGNAAGNAAGRQAIGDGAGGGAGATSKTAACGETATVVPASVAAARALFSTMDGNVATDRGIKAALFSAAAQVLDGSLVLDKATVIAEGGAKRTQLMEMGREWPNTEFGGLLGAIVDAE